MPTTSATIVKTVLPTPDFYGDTAAANAGTDSVVWDGNYASMLTVKIQNPVMLRVTSNDFENPASCSVYVYFDIDSGVSADEAEALWLSGLLKKIEPSQRTQDNQAVPFEMYNLWKMTAKEMMTNATTGGVSGTSFSYDSSNPRTQVWPRLLFTKFTFKLYNNIAGMPTSGMVVGLPSWPS
eukprot:tig00000270_g23912.t1